MTHTLRSLDFIESQAEFKQDVETRYNQSHSNQNYVFPRGIESQETSNASSDIRLDSQEYNLHSQNRQRSGASTHARSSTKKVDSDDYDSDCSLDAKIRERDAEMKEIEAETQAEKPQAKPDGSTQADLANLYKQTMATYIKRMQTDIETKDQKRSEAQAPRVSSVRPAKNVIVKVVKQRESRTNIFKSEKKPEEKIRRRTDLSEPKAISNGSKDLLNFIRSQNNIQTEQEKLSQKIQKVLAEAGKRREERSQPAVPSTGPQYKTLKIQDLRAAGGAETTRSKTNVNSSPNKPKIVKTIQLVKATGEFKEVATLKDISELNVRQVKSRNTLTEIPDSKKITIKKQVLTLASISSLQRISLDSDEERKEKELQQSLEAIANTIARENIKKTKKDLNQTSIVLEEEASSPASAEKSKPTTIVPLKQRVNLKVITRSVVAEHEERQNKKKTLRVETRRYL